MFSETVQTELMRLSEGDKLAAQGSLRLELYNGKISRSVFVDAILPLRAPPRTPKAKAVKPAPASQDQAKQSVPPSSDLNDDLDDLPF